jgi:hypothetical protein
LNLRFSDRRIEELSILAKRNEMVPELLIIRWEMQMREAFRYILQLNDDAYISGLGSLQRHLRVQDNELRNLGNSGNNDPLILEMLSRIQSGLSNVNDGLVNPVQFRLKLKQQESFDLFQQHRNRTPDQNNDPIINSNTGEQLEKCDNCEALIPAEEKAGESYMNQNGLDEGHGFENCLDCDPYGPLNGSSVNSPWGSGTLEPETGKYKNTDACEVCEMKSQPKESAQKKTSTPENGENTGSGSKTGPGSTDQSDDGDSSGSGGRNRP